MEKTLLIDGNSLVNRAYYALPPLNNPSGVPVQAVYGFATMLIKMIETVKPDYIVTAFDVGQPTFRHKMYDGYKAHRKKMPDDLAVQMPILKQMLDEMGIKRVELPGYEADDLIGTLSKRFNTFIYIVTGDRDSLQLIDDKTTVMLTKRGITEIDEVNEKTLLSEYGLTPKGVIYYKSLAGDTSDEIPGVPGIGDKTAKNLLSKYKTLDGVFEHAEEEPPRIRNLLEGGRDSAYMSQALATINTAAPVECEQSECKYGFPFEQRVFSFFESQSFKSLLKRTELFDAPEAVVKKREEAQLVSLNSVEDILNVLKNKDGFGIHITESKLHLAVDEQTEYEVNLSYNLLESGLAEGEVISAIKDKLVNPEITKTVFDSKQFIKYIFDNYKIDCDGFFDIRLGQYIADSTVAHDSLEGLSEYYSLSAKTPCASMLALKSELSKQLDENGMNELYYKIELPLVKVLLQMERIGFEVNKQKLEEIGAAFTEEEQRLTESIHAEAGSKFNIKSPKQLAKVLFEDLAIPYPRKGAKTYNTSAEILEQLDSSYKIVPLVLRYRFISKLNSTYIDGLKKMIDPSGNVHTEFRQTLTTTGRLSSVEPNLQNIPVREEDGKILRSLFVARDGYTLVSADYSQIELRIMAHYSQDPIMLEAYRTGEDIHALTASQVFGVPLSDVTPTMRRTAKSVNFGIIYGISDFGLAENLKISRYEAKKYIDNYFSRFVKVREYLDDCVSNAKRNGYVTTLLNRRRKIPELHASQYFTRQFGERAAMNMPLQGTAADIIKIAMLNVNDALKNMRSRIILQIHDELIIETALDELDEVKAIVKEKMENAYKLSVPLLVEVGEGKSLFDCK